MSRIEATFEAWWDVYLDSYRAVSAGETARRSVGKIGWGEGSAVFGNIRSLAACGNINICGPLMRKRDLTKILYRKGIPEDWYSLNGGLPNEALCLNKAGANWEVYYSEKGGKSGLKQFDSEDEACDYFYELIMKVSNNENKVDL